MGECAPHPPPNVLNCKAEPMNIPQTPTHGEHGDASSESLRWPWPTHRETESLLALARRPETTVTSHQNPVAAHFEHPDGQSLWAVHLDVRPREGLQLTPQDLLRALEQPLTAEHRSALEDRVTTLLRKVRDHGLSPRRRNPLHPAAWLDAEVDILVRHRRTSAG
jgi:hypothetical protein